MTAGDVARRRAWRGFEFFGDRVPAGCPFVLPVKQPSHVFYTVELVRQITDAVDITGSQFKAVWTREHGALPYECDLAEQGQPILDPPR